ncbi:hypothetical protein D3C79_948740 [compost metagenome]
MLSARSGTPRLLSGDRLFGAMPVFDMAQRMRVEAYSPELPTERMAVRMTKFIRSAAKGMPTMSNTCTNGLSISPACSNGTMAESTAIAST